ncbi:MAG: 50S ribosomal protein L24 [Nanoarchaeota archaeon]
MPTCTFCKKVYEFPRGLTIFTIDGKSIYYCSSKCRRNAALKRDPKKLKWVRRRKTEEVKGEIKK